MEKFEKLEKGDLVRTGKSGNWRVEGIGEREVKRKSKSNWVDAICLVSDQWVPAFAGMLRRLIGFVFRG
jgi:cysteine synthase